MRFGFRDDATSSARNGGAGQMFGMLRLHPVFAKAGRSHRHYMREYAGHDAVWRNQRAYSWPDGEMHLATGH